MKLKFVICLWILSIGKSSYAQNLVPNGNFELHSSCPFGTAQFSVVTNWINAQPYTSPDYFNSCSSTNANVPNTVFGYQNDYSNGNGIAGIYTFNKGFPNNGRDYIQVLLNDTLKMNRKYLASMYVNNSGSFDYCIVTLGMHFTNTSMSWPTNIGFINVPNPKVKNLIKIKDTVNWILVQDTIRGNGEMFATIGNFSTDNQSDTMKITGNGTFFGAAYNFIDGVNIYDVTGGSCNNLWDAGNDKYLFFGDSIRLGAINTDNSSYLWQNSVAGPTYLSNSNDSRPWSKPTQTTKYYVTKTCSSNVFSDTVTVFVSGSSGISNIKNYNNDFLLFPNPTKNALTLKYNYKGNATLRIISLQGVELNSYELLHNGGRLHIPELNLEDGLYFYTISDSSKILTNGKVVIVK